MRGRRKAAVEELRRWRSFGGEVEAEHMLGRDEDEDEIADKVEDADVVEKTDEEKVENRLMVKELLE